MLHTYIYDMWYITSWAGKGAFAFLARFDLYWFIVVMQLHSLTVGTVIMLDYAIKMQRQNDSKVEEGTAKNCIKVGAASGRSECAMPKSSGQ